MGGGQWQRDVLGLSQARGTRGSGLRPAALGTMLPGRKHSIHTGSGADRTGAAVSNSGNQVDCRAMDLGGEARLGWLGLGCGFKVKLNQAVGSAELESRREAGGSNQARRHPCRGSQGRINSPREDPG